MKKTIIALVCGLITALFTYLGVIDGYDHFLTDFLYQKPQPINNKIKIIAIDEKSLETYGPYNRWDRSNYAGLLDVLYKDPDNRPSVTAFDMIFQGESDPNSDAAFAEAAGRAGNVVTASNLVFRDKIQENEKGQKYLNHLYVEMIEEPYEALREITVQGFANTINDSSDNGVRMYLPYINAPDPAAGDERGESAIPSLAVAAAKYYCDSEGLPLHVPPVAPGESAIIRYTGRPGDYEAISFCDVMAGNIPPAVFKDCIVFVGAYAPGMMDSFTVPTGHGTVMYGVEIHANIFQSLIEGKYMLPTIRAARSAVYGAVAFAFALLAQLIPFAASGVLGIAIIAAQFVVGVNLSNNHKFVPLITLPVFIILIEALALALRYVNSLVQRQKVLKAFRQYVAPQVVEEIARKGDYELKLGGERRHIAVLFVDIRGFTPLSESLEPEEVVAILNEYLALTTKSIFDNGGTLDKFVGDATMAVFNSPFDLDDYIYRAVCAAGDIVAGSEMIRKKAFEMTGKQVGFGVGVNCGDAVVGNIGCDFRMDYTAIGDTVNTAARLEANAKASQVLLSPAVIEALGDRIVANEVGELSLKGKAVPMKVSELVEIKGRQ